MAKGKKLRLQRVQALGVHWPPYARLLIKEMTKDCVDNGRTFFSFAIPDSPLSLNHQYEHISRWGKGKNGKARQFQSKKLKPEVHDFRALVKEAMEASPGGWSASGVTAAVILFEDPIWITAEHRARRHDADNKVKPLMDAIERATGVPDELHWNLHIFKVASARQRTLVYLFDLGDIVEFFTKEA